MMVGGRSDVSLSIRMDTTQVRAHAVARDALVVADGVTAVVVVIVPWDPF
jgi:hypothetical protein